MSDIEYEGTPDEEEDVENDSEQGGDSEEDYDPRLGDDTDATFEDGSTQ